MSPAKILAIAGTGLRRLFRDRFGLFFVLIFPVQIILIIGVSFFDSDTALSVGVFDEDTGVLSRQLVSDLRSSETLEVRTFDDQKSLSDELLRESLVAAVIIPKGYEEELMGGASVEISFLAGGQRSNIASTARSAVVAAVAEQGSLVKSALFAAEQTGADFSKGFDVASRLESETQGLVGRSEAIGSRRTSLPSGFTYPAASNLVLFVFLTSLSGAGILIANRQSGISTRMLSTPTSVRSILFGETMSRFGIALFQGLFIFIVGTFAFGAKWGDPLGTTVVILLWSLVGTGAAMLIGSILRTPQIAFSLGPPLGIGLGMLGGTMWPLEVVSPTMQTVGHFTPHAWAMDAFVALIVRGATLAEILPEIMVLATTATILFSVATVRLRKSLVG